VPNSPSGCRRPLRKGSQLPPEDQKESHRDLTCPPRTGPSCERELRWAKYHGQREAGELAGRIGYRADASANRVAEPADLKVPSRPLSQRLSIQTDREVGGRASRRVSSHPQGRGPLALRHPTSGARGAAGAGPNGVRAPRAHHIDTAVLMVSPQREP
jgi:hypothetical protein